MGKFLTLKKLFFAITSIAFIFGPLTFVHAQEDFVMSISPVSVLEGNNVELTIVRFDASATTTYRILTRPVTAQPGIDYSAIDRSFEFARGKTKIIERIITIVNAPEKRTRDFSVGVCLESDCGDEKIQWAKVWILDRSSGFDAGTPSAVLEKDSTRAIRSGDPTVSGNTGESILPCGFVAGAQSDRERGMVWDESGKQKDKCGWKYTAKFVGTVTTALLLALCTFLGIFGIVLYSRFKSEADAIKRAPLKNRIMLMGGLILFALVLWFGIQMLISYMIGFNSPGDFLK